MVVIGAFLLLATVLIAPGIYTSWRGWRAVSATPAATAHPGQVVVAAGRATAGAGGILTAPLSHEPCVWYQQEVRQHLSRPARSGHERDVRVESVTTAERPFGVTDEHGRVVMIRPEDLRQIDLRWSHRAERDAESHERAGPAPAANLPPRRWSMPYETTGFETLEWIIAPDDPVVVGGLVAPDGQVTAPRRGPYVVRRADIVDVRRRRMRVLVLSVGATLATAALGLALTFAGT